MGELLYFSRSKPSKLNLLEKRSIFSNFLNRFRRQNKKEKPPEQSKQEELLQELDRIFMEEASKMFKLLPNTLHASVSAVSAINSVLITLMGSSTHFNNAYCQFFRKCDEWTIPQLHIDEQPPPLARQVDTPYMTMLFKLIALYDPQRSNPEYSAHFNEATQGELSQEDIEYVLQNSHKVQLPYIIKNGRGLCPSLLPFEMTAQHYKLILAKLVKQQVMINHAAATRSSNCLNEFVQATLCPYIASSIDSIHDLSEECMAKIIEVVILAVTWSESFETTLSSPITPRVWNGIFKRLEIYLIDILIERKNCKAKLDCFVRFMNIIVRIPRFEQDRYDDVITSAFLISTKSISTTDSIDYNELLASITSIEKRYVFNKTILHFCARVKRFCGMSISKATLMIYNPFACNH